VHLQTILVYTNKLALQETQTRSSVITDEYTFITDEVTEEYNADKYMPLYSLVPMNIKVYFSIITNRQIY
jgi:hypothetical protein